VRSPFPPSRRPALLRGTALAVALAVAAGCAVESSGATLERAEPSTTAPTTTTEAPTTTAAPTTTTTEAPAVDIADLRPPAPAEDPAALAAQIAAAEATIDDRSSSELALAEAALAQQVGYRRLADRPEWDEPVLAALPAHLHARAQRHAAARREFTAMHTRFSDMLPAWEIVAPAPREELMAHYLAAQEEFGVRWEHLASINLVETGMGRIRGYSVAGARGPMQFMPATWDAFGEGDIDDPRDAIRAAARYLTHSGYAQDIDRALFAYNRSNRYVRGVRLYADLMIDDPRAFDALYHWGILYRTVHGDVYLPVGYAEPEQVPALDHLARAGAGTQE
jgi:membrane-bound lytic murein transglycosylase B